MRLSLYFIISARDGLRDVLDGRSCCLEFDQDFGERMYLFHGNFHADCMQQRQRQWLQVNCRS